MSSLLRCFIYLDSMSFSIWCNNGFSTLLNCLYMRITFWSFSLVCIASTAVVAASMISTPKKAGAANVVDVGLICAYFVSVKINHRHPWPPPPRSVSTLLEFARSSVLSLLSNFLVGSPLMGVGTGYLNYVTA